jgi:hypothetical protein
MPRIVSLPDLKLKDPKDLRRPDAFYICRAVGLTQATIAEEAGSVQGIVAATFNGTRSSESIKKATAKLLKQRGYKYTVAELFGDTEPKR